MQYLVIVLDNHLLIFLQYTGKVFEQTGSISLFFLQFMNIKQKDLNACCSDLMRVMLLNYIKVSHQQVFFSSFSTYYLNSLFTY